MNIRALILLCFIISLGISFPAVAATFDEDEYTLLELQYQRQTLGNGIESYFHNGTLYILLIDIISALELSVSVAPDEAKGFIASPADSFNLEHKNNEWHVATKKTSGTVNDGDIVVHNSYIYVNEALIEDWFGLHFQLSYAELTLTFTTSKKLPVIERLRRQNRIIGPTNFDQPAKNPILDTPYELFELPSADLRSTTFIRDTENSGTTSKSFYTLITHGDLGYMNTRLFANGSQEDDIKNASIRMDRYDKTGNLAGPLHLSQISLGDLSFPSIPLAPGSNGRGMLIGNDSSSRQNTQDTTTIEGDYYPGQEVELYFGGSLIGYQVIPESGHYAFEDVILFPGDNAFVLKFYGINGTVETEDRNIRVGDTADGGNNLKYNFSISQPNKTMIDIDNTNDDTADKTHSAFTSRYTFNRYLSGKAGYVYNDTGEESSNYFNAGLQAHVFGNSFSITATTKEDELLGVVYGLGGYIFGTRYNLGLVEYNDISDVEEDPSIISNRRESTYNLGLNKRFENGGFTLKSKRNIRTQGFDEEHRLGISGGLWGTQWSSIHVYKNADYGILETPEEDFDGGFFIARSFYPVSLRLNLAYEVLPEYQLTTAGLSFSFSPTPKSTVNFGATHNVLTDTTDYELSGSWKFKYLQITPRVRYDGFNNTTAVVDFSTSIGKRTGRFGNYFNLDTQRRSNRGALRARLFEDSNLNGSYDEGEDLLSGGRISAPQYRSKGRSNKGGIAWIEHTKPWVLTDIDFEPNSLDAYSMRYSGKPFSVAIRPGKVTEVDMPFTRTGDIDGTVLRQEASGIKLPVRGAIIVALDKSGNVAAENRSDLDGYFSFEGLMPNTYSLSVKNEEVISRSKNKVTITNNGEFIGDYQMIIAPREIEDPNSPARSFPPSIKSKTIDTPPKKNTIKSMPMKAPTKITPTKTFPLKKPDPIVTNYRPLKKPIPEGKNTLPTSKEKEAKPFPNPTPLPTQKFSIATKQNSPAKTFIDVIEADRYAVKIGSFSNRSYAIDSVKRMKALGHPTYTEVVNTSKGFFTRVFVGPIDNRDDAIKIKKKINTEFGEKAFLVPFES